MRKRFECAGKIKLFALDLDGTLYMGGDVITGAIELVDYLRKRYKVVFFTNNSSRTKREVSEKLNRLGIKCGLSELYTSSALTAFYLNESGIDNLYVVGSRGLRREIKNSGLRIMDNASARNLVVGLDLDFNYKKIATALSVLLKGGRFIACNEDNFFPVEKNKYMPGCGAMVGAIAASANRRPDFIVGKPNTYILSRISKTFGVKPHEIMVVGDSYESDIVMALNYNSKAILIGLKGSVLKRDVLIIENLHKLLQYLKEGK
ncbi:MAG: HAD-IIA family hydrolase [Candidatus Omnitrophica bacterium]|nr:HAD-IIA family hydrolase [Candidatus Omnitrophota bacterium]